MEPPKNANSELPVWQSALLSQGCHVNSAGHLFPLELLPIGNHLVCNPAMNGSMVPFNVDVTAGQPVTINWDAELSRYIVTMAGRRLAA